MAAGPGVAAFENHAGGLGHDLDTRDPAASAVRSTDGPGLESAGSGGVDKHFGYRCVCFDLKFKEERGKWHRAWGIGQRSEIGRRELEKRK